MFCPNCRANNHKRQNYCRFCGLNLQDVARSLTNQLAFGEDSNLLKTLGSVRRVVDFASAALVGVITVGVVAYLFLGQGLGQDLMKVGLGVFFLLKIIQEVVGYYQRRERGKTGASKFEQDRIEQLGARETSRLLEEKPRGAIPSVVENSTELLPINNKAHGPE
jgi:hypothetical protein